MMRLVQLGLRVMILSLLLLVDYPGQSLFVVLLQSITLIVDLLNILLHKSIKIFIQFILLFDLIIEAVLD